MLSKNLPFMPALCSKLAYYAGIMLDALACLLCLNYAGIIGACLMPMWFLHTFCDGF